MTAQQIALLGRTVMHLRPGQIAHRARLRTQRAALCRWPGLGPRLLARETRPAQAGWPTGFIPLDARLPGRWPTAASLRAGQLELLGTRRDLGDPADWEQADWEQAGAPKLWRFHLHYWDWAWGLARDLDRAAAQAVFGRLWESWRHNTVLGRGDAWLPYPAALRAWSWCGLHAALVAGTPAETAFRRELAAHAGFLRRHLESDVGGNHLLKDLKALVGLAVFFADGPLLKRSLRRLTRQLAIQVLPDGGHYERAPAYHCQVLGDLTDLAGLLAATGHEPDPALDEAVTRMRGWLGSVLSPTGDVPLLNDGYPVPAALISALQPGPRPSQRLLVLPDTGLIRAQADGWDLLADVGPPCPDELPAHAHADTLSCVVHVDGAPLLIDTATSTYERGPARDFERSTAAHNTAEIDGTDSTEVWGAFRAGRRARVRGIRTTDNGGVVTVEASHNGYRQLPGHPRHQRRWSLSGDGLLVEDFISGRGQHAVAIRWHLPPGSAIQVAGQDATVTVPGGAFQVSVHGPGSAVLTAGQAPVATGFQRTACAPVLACQVTAQLPVHVSTGWQRASGGHRGAAAPIEEEQ